MEYTITNVQRRDEWESQYGLMVTFAIALQGQDGWIKLNQKLTTPEPRVGETIYGDIISETDRNGNSYKKFKKVNPKFQQPTSQGASAHQIEYIIQMLEELTGRREVKDTVVNDIEDDPFPGL